NVVFPQFGLPARAIRIDMFLYSPSSIFGWDWFWLVVSGFGVMVAARKFRKRREFWEMRQHSPWTLKFESRDE
ncbi:MAG: hypothetical protein Q4F94_06550, partial [Dialister sp.]|nr:hypothetical protein [Dialister sp.]